MEGFEGFELGPWMDLVWDGLWVTVSATALGTLLATAIAFILGLLELHPNVVLRGSARWWWSSSAAPSLVVQMFWIVYACPSSPAT